MGRRTVMFVLGFLALVGGLVFFLWPHETNQPYSLRIVRQTVERGKPVVLFTIGGGGPPPIVRDVAWVGTKSDQQVFFRYPTEGQSEFRVFVPTNAEIGKLRVTFFRHARQLERYMIMPINWRNSRSRGFSVRTSWQRMWAARTTTQEIKSDLITNSVPQPEEKFSP